MMVSGANDCFIFPQKSKKGDQSFSYVTYGLLELQPSVEVVCGYPEPISDEVQVTWWDVIIDEIDR